MGGKTALKAQKPGGYDYVLLIPTLLLLGLGLVAIYSASSFLAAHRMGDSYYFLKRQGGFCLLGLFLLIVAKNLPLGVYRKLVYPSLGISALLLLLVFVPGIGMRVGGASRWISIGGFSFQPSELAKLSLALYLAYSMSKKGDDMARFSTGFVPHLLVAGAFMGLILVQPDLGTCVIIAGWLLVLLFVGGVRFRHLLLLGLISAPGLAWLIWTSPYRLRRWWAFLNPWDDPQGLGFQIIHSFLAIGSGGIFGLGLGNSKQKLFYLPEPHTDFIFSILAEELGLVGVSVVVVLFGIVIARGIYIALNARDLYGSYLALGISCFLGFQVLINMGVVMGLLPTKGLTLPFLSYGGSSLVVSLLGIGILLSISARR
ncbi:MAG: putative lipid II flippase FtsW [Deltaproteobacteria bacterium]|nr:putative lipid II flippase FtsW [Deltaproteobacteria bacterium]